MFCPICYLEMDPVELNQVPADDIKNFVNKPGNKLDDNWYWCPKCDCYDQRTTPPAKLSPEAERVRKMIEYFSII